MSRLIDADKLVRAIWDKYNSRYNNASIFDEEQTELANMLLTDVQALIELQPTAYEVDKVVEQLESEIELKVTQYPLHGTYIKKNRAIEIVKGGGKSD